MGSPLYAAESTCTVRTQTHVHTSHEYAMNTPRIRHEHAYMHKLECLLVTVPSPALAYTPSHHRHMVHMSHVCRTSAGGSTHGSTYVRR